MELYQHVHQIGNRLIDKAHFFVFGKAVSTNTLHFFRNMGYMSLGALASGMLLFVVQVVAIRFLGPEEYGKIALVFTAANFLPLFMLMGLQASLIKYLPEYEHKQDTQVAIIATGFWSSIFFMGTAFIFFYFFRDVVAQLFGMSTEIVIIAVVFSLLSALRLGVESILKGLLQFGKQARIDVLCAVITFVVFFIIFLSKRLALTFVDYLFSFSVGFLAYVFIVLMRYKQYLGPSSFDTKTLKTLLLYGIYSIVGSIGLFILWGSDRFFLNKFLDVKTVGIYAAYYGASLMILGRLISIFMKVFLPMASSSRDKRSLELRMNRFMGVVFFPLLFFNALVIYIMLLIYGGSYPINVRWIFLFSLNAMLYIFINAKGSLLVSEGVRGQRFYSVWSLGMAILIFTLNVYMIPSLGIDGAILAVIIVSLLFLIGLSLYSRRIFLRPSAMGDISIPSC